MKRLSFVFVMSLVALVQNALALEKHHSINVGIGIQNDLAGFNYSYIIPLSGSFFIAPQLGLGALTIGGGLKSSSDLGLEMLIPQIGVSFGTELDKGLLWAATLGFSHLEGGESPHGSTDLTEWTIVEAFKYMGVWRRKSFDHSSWYYSLGLELGLHTTKIGKKITGNQLEFEESTDLMPMLIANIGKSF